MSDLTDNDLTSMLCVSLCPSDLGFETEYSIEEGHCGDSVSCNINSCWDSPIARYYVNDKVTLDDLGITKVHMTGKQFIDKYLSHDDKVALLGLYCSVKDNQCSK